MNSKSETNDSRSEDSNYDQVDFSDIYDLSFLELLTLNFLSNLEVGKEQILRYDLYKKMNQLVRPIKKLSTGSFYTRILQNRMFKERKLIKFHEIKTKEGGLQAVSITPKGRRIVGFHQYYLLQHTITSSTRVHEELVESIFKFTGKEEFNSIMVIEPDTYKSGGLQTSIIPMAAEFIKILGLISSRIYLLTTDMLFEHYLREGIENLGRSDIKDGVIFAPNEFFDFIIFPLYGENIKYYDKNYLEILRETKRLLSPKGTLLVIHHESIETSNNHYVESLLTQLVASGYYHPQTNTMQELKSIGFTDLKSDSIVGLKLIYSIKE